jgi:simple sugar transport system permease protein
MLGIISQFFNPQSNSEEHRQQTESMMGGFGAAGSLLQRRLGLPDASVQVLLGFAFVLILAMEAARGKLRWGPPLRAVPQGAS